MSRRNEIENVTGNELYSIEVYPESYFESFNPDKVFDKWAAVEISDFSKIPEGMDYLIIPPDLYAIFIHKGPESEGPKTYEYIFREWLPASGFGLNRNKSMLFNKFDNSKKNFQYVCIENTFL